MNSREHSDLPPTGSFPSPNAAQINQGTMSYYNRQLTADELLSAELSREAASGNLTDNTGNGLHHGQSMVLGSSNPGPGDMARASSADHQHSGMLPFTPNQQVGVDPNHDLSYGDQSARRKRSKVSRACDECRRKKVRCDATSESGVETCSNCRRLGVACQFSRVPMKRGPSKGYIKELAERLNTLESQMQPPMPHTDMQYNGMHDVSSPRGYQEFSPPIDSSLLSRKRTYSMSEGLTGSSFPQPVFSSRPPQAAVGDSNPVLQDPYTSFMMPGSVSRLSQPFWASGQQDLQGLEVSDVSRPAPEDSTPISIDDGALTTYYQRVHPFLAVLPTTKEALERLLQQCSRDLQEVFLYGLYAATRTNLERTASTFQKVLSFDAAQELVLNHLRENPAIRSHAVNFIWLQAMQLMLLEYDSHGPENQRPKTILSKSALSEAVAKLAHDVASKFGQIRGWYKIDTQETDSDASTARRGWLVAGILCRWHALAVAEIDPIASWNPMGTGTDQRLFGLPTTQLAAYSSLLSPLLEIITGDDEYPGPDTHVNRSMKTSLQCHLERLYELERSYELNDRIQIPSSYLTAIGPQIFWTLSLVVSRHLYLYSPYEVLYCAEAVIKEMHKQVPDRQTTPLDLYSLVLATMTLLEGTELPAYNSLAWEVIGKVEQVLDRRAKAASDAGEFENLFATPTWDNRLRALIDNKRARDHSGSGPGASSALNANGPAPPLVGPNEQRSLQHLADLAVGAEGAVAGASSPPPTGATADGVAAPPFGGQQASQQNTQVSVDFTLLTKRGFMNVLAALPLKPSY